MFKNTDEKRFASGLLIGFFLATGLMFALIQFTLGPYYNDLMKLKPQVEILYGITHSGMYGGMQGLIANVNNAADVLAQIPIIGAGIDATKIPAYAQSMGSMMETARMFTENVLVLINFEITLLQLAIPAIILSVVMIAVGANMHSECNKKAKGKKSRRK
ncbi:Uncharacterised protein [Candidatus Anstonella stagnisolia]|nr:Uncharacterised protein [Candidatus Anstonella stagnisolia]